MKSFDDIIKEIERLPIYDELLKLKEQILKDDYFLEEHRRIQGLQKEVVRFEYYTKNKEGNELKDLYLRRLSDFEENIVVSTYLNQLEEFSDFVHELELIINQNL